MSKNEINIVEKIGKIEARESGMSDKSKSDLGFIALFIPTLILFVAFHPLAGFTFMAIAYLLWGFAFKAAGKNKPKWFKDITKGNGYKISASSYNDPFFNNNPSSISITNSRNRCR